MVKQEVKDKICLLYDGADSNYVSEAHQIKIIFHAESKNLEKFIEQYPDKTIYIEFKEDNFTEDNMRRLQGLKQFNNWILQIPVSMILNKQKRVDNVRFDAIKDCCNKYMFLDLIGNWEILQFIKTLNPCEVYITNMLGFCLEKVQRVIGNDVGIRLVCNMAQSSWTDSENISKFFVRPEDTDVYEPFVSGFDFIGTPAIQDVCYKVYCRGYWYGDLNELIIGFTDSVDNRRLPRQFGEYRLKCEKRCIRGSKCQLCNKMRHFSEQMAKTETVVIPKVKDN